MKKECSVIRDLLPLYVEEMVSPETESFIKEHLETCGECAAELEVISNTSKVDCIVEEKITDSKNDIVFLKNVKQRFRRSRVLTIFVSVVLTLVLAFACTSFWPASINYGFSQLYTKEDRASAIALIKERFDKWEGCKLYSISYTNDGLCERELEYCNDLAKEGVIYSECIVFRTKFHTSLFGKNPTLNSNFTYDWSWYLARTQGGEWEILTWGAP